MRNVPTGYELALLTLAAYRIYRGIAKDTITEPVRAAVSMPDHQAVTLSQPPRVIGPEEVVTKTLRVYVATLIRCAWCAGLYVSFATWGAWMLWPNFTLVAAAPLAIATLVGLTAKNLDP